MGLRLVLIHSISVTIAVEASQARGVEGFKDEEVTVR